MRLGSLLSRLAFVPCVAILLLAACGDGVTEPASNTSIEARASRAGTGTPGNVTTTTESQCSANPSEGCYIVGTCNHTDAFQSCHEQGGGSYSGGTGGTTGGSGGSGTGTGGNTGYDSPSGEPQADDEVVDCHLSNSGNCDMRPADTTQVRTARAKAANIRDAGICGSVKSMAQQMIGNGLQVWSNEVRQNGSLLAGDMGYEFVNPTGVEKVAVMHLWTDPRGMNAWTIAHEALHGLGYKHEDSIVGPDGSSRKMDQTAKYCANA
ncbi:MAG TPA: hypothetical protein VF263_02180 [Longimicrobiaceae bacterium]